MKVLGTPKPTDEQLKIIADTRTGTEIIRGAAGSGKTTTALLRLRNLTDMFRARHKRMGIAEPVKTLVLTYNRTLCGYVEALAEEQATRGGGVSLEVRTFAQWARQFAIHPNIINDRTGRISRLAALEGVKLPSKFVASEVEYVMGRFLPGSSGAYLDAERAGRGIAPRVERPNRELILKVIEKYRAEIAKAGFLDWEDLTAAALSAPPRGYQIIVVDEAQDFSANQIRALRRHLANEYALTLVIDTAQRLYPRGYTWLEAGIVARQAQFYRLAQNHRNTVEIAEFASGIVSGLKIDDDGTLPDLTKATRRGPLPLVLKGKYSGQLDAAIDNIRKNVDLKSETVAFLKPLGGLWFREVEGRLKREKLPYDDITRSREWPDNDTNIVLSTMHSAKGLEFDHVVILGLSEEVTPHGSDEDDDQLLTLRRLLAMAVARARKSVTIGYKASEASGLVRYFRSGTFTERAV
ncbi:3'-5' exonuclease [Mesorhizobium sp. ISC11]|uniref:3'-5' exonuclease n=1 Tax=Mesorhizobium sp. ISC11 TaxID=3076428 RepID=UPI00301E1EBA